MASMNNFEQLAMWNFMVIMLGMSALIFAVYRIFEKVKDLTLIFKEAAEEIRITQSRIEARLGNQRTRPPGQ